jgi:hypothetical protein
MERQRIVVDVDDVVDLEGVAPSCTSLQGTALTSQTSPNNQWTDRDSNSNFRIANAAYSLCTISPTLSTRPRNRTVSSRLGNSLVTMT